MSSTSAPTVASVLVSGARDLVLPVAPTYLDPFELHTEMYSIDCASGDSETGEWSGIRVGALLERAGVDETATHLLVTGVDGYRICVPLTDALDALLAVSRRDVPDDGTLPRLVGTSIEGTRSVGQVTLIETVRLEPGEAEDRYERRPHVETPSNDPPDDTTSSGRSGSPSGPVGNRSSRR